MDLNLLSAESYYDDSVTEPNAQTEHQNGSSQWTEGLGSNSTQPRKLTKQRELPANPRARQPSKRESSKTANVDESNGVRQRGRPRLDTRDQNAAEVYAPHSSWVCGEKADQTVSYSVAGPRYDWLSEPIDSERRRPYPR